MSTPTVQHLHDTTTTPVTGLTDPAGLIDPTGLLAALDGAGLTGRGGAAFPTATKVRAAVRAGAPLIVNACDGEVDAAKDAYVVREHLPELVRGAGRLAGDRVTYAARRGSDTLARLRAAGLPVLDVPDRYVSSEESALVALAAGGLARPLAKDVPVAYGTAGHSPTLVLNAETVWRVDEIATYGPDWFASLGEPDEPGPRLVTVATGGAGHSADGGLDGGARGGAGSRVVVETQAGEPVADLLSRAGVDPRGVAHVLVGGLSGMWMTADEALTCRWSATDLARYGARPASGVLRVVPHGACPLDVVAQHLRYAAGESAGQCGPCMFGVPAVASDLLALAEGSADAGARGRLDARLPLLAGRGACRFPDGIAGYAASVLRVLGRHLDEHAAGRCDPAAGSAWVTAPGWAPGPAPAAAPTQTLATTPTTAMPSQPQERA